MCDTCGCGDPEVVPVDVHEKILAGNDRTAAHNREHFRERHVVAVNLMGSPGAGKTAVLEATARLLAGRARLGALAGDLATDNDADRLARGGIVAKSITTGSACHLDAAMVHRGLHDFRGTSSITCSSKTSATWCARPSTTSARRPTSSRCRSPRAKTSR